MTTLLPCFCFKSEGCVYNPIFCFITSNHSFSDFAIAILDFSLLLFVKLSLLILLASFFVSVLCFFFYGSLSKVIALPTLAIAIDVPLSRLKAIAKILLLLFNNAFKSVKERQLLLL